MYVPGYFQYLNIAVVEFTERQAIDDQHIDRVDHLDKDSFVTTASSEHLAFKNHLPRLIEIYRELREFQI